MGRSTAISIRIPLETNFNEDKPASMLRQRVPRISLMFAIILTALSFSILRSLNSSHARYLSGLEPFDKQAVFGGRYASIVVIAVVVLFLVTCIRMELRAMKE